MPYQRFDEEAFEEYAQELGLDEEHRPSGKYEYESAEATFKAGQLGPVARVVFDALAAAGATGFDVKYDGGYDEGFSHPDALQFGDDRARPAQEVAKSLASAKLVAEIRAAAGKSSMWGNASEFYAGLSDDKVVLHALDELAHELASRLLGEGYGTGEYQLYGAFTADLVTGDITDHENVEKPDSVD